MTLPIVHHPIYNARFTHNRRFPVGKFQRLAEILLEEGLPGAGGFHVPDPVEPHMIALATTAPTLIRFCLGNYRPKLKERLVLPSMIRWQYVPDAHPVEHCTPRGWPANLELHATRQAAAIMPDGGTVPDTAYSMMWPSPYANCSLHRRSIGRW